MNCSDLSAWLSPMLNICLNRLYLVDFHAVFLIVPLITLNHFLKLFGNLYHISLGIISYRCHFNSSSFWFNELKFNVFSIIINAHLLIFLPCLAWRSIWRSLISFDLHLEFQVLLLLNDFAFELGDNLDFIRNILDWGRSCFQHFSYEILNALNVYLGDSIIVFFMNFVNLFLDLFNLLP